MLFINGCGEECSFTTTMAVEGKVAKGSIRGATIKIYALPDIKLLATTLTDQDGKYKANIEEFDGIVKVESSGGSYIDESDGQEKDATILSLKAISVINSTNNTVNITPLTKLSADKLENEIGLHNIDKSKIYEVIKENVEVALVMIGEEFDVTKVTPQIVNEEPITDSFEGKYGLILADISDLSNSDASKVEEVVEQLYEEKADDTILQTQDNNPPVSQITDVVNSEMTESN